ncbi:melatonin receptor type 1B-A-like [Amphiura filiformis]|uniref:melatonin receptor type 1B-A-like n=1 Tax=Amphiura filiformis TaxID=82378 RepID=UPI003B21724C
MSPVSYSSNSTLEEGTSNISMIAQYIFIVWYSFNSIAGALGNALVIICICTSKKLQTFTNAFVMNLSIADVLVCTVCMPVEIYFFAHRQDGGCIQQQKHPNLCFVIGILIIGLCSVSIFSLASISFNRYLLIVHGANIYRKIFNRRFIPLVIACSYLWGCSVLLPPFFGWGGFGYNTAKGMCDYDHDTPSNYEMYTICFSIGAPLIITFMCYMQIFVTVRKSRLRVAQHELIVNRKEERRKKDLKLTKDLFIIFGMFCFCVLPYMLAEFIDHEYHLLSIEYHLFATEFIDHEYHLLSIEYHLFASILVASNSTWNPFLYAWRNRDFRNAMKRVLSFKILRSWESENTSVSTM